MLEELKDKNILITGGTGFIGKCLTRLLSNYGAKVYPLGCNNYVNAWRCADLRSSAQCNAIFSQAACNGHPFDYVFHLAGYNGGIIFNVENPAKILHDNLLINTNVLEACKNYYISKIVSTITSCGYAWDYKTEHGMLEENYQMGEPHASVAPHGYAKRMLALASRYYYEQYKLNAITVCPTTVYGPGDRFDEGRSKVLSGLIYKFLKAKQEKQTIVTLYGTGQPLREFIYVGDLVRLLALSLLKYDNHAFPLNLGSGHEVSVAELANMVARSVEYTGKIQWDTLKPDGQMRKLLNTSNQRSLFGDIHMTSLKVGIDITVQWCLAKGIVCN